MNSLGLLSQKVISLAILLALSGCVATDEPYQVRKSPMATNSVDTADKEELRSSDEPETKLSELNTVPGAGVTPPDVKKVNSPKFDSTPVTIKANSLPVAEFIHTVFGELLSLDYALDMSVKNSGRNATLNIDKPMAKSRLFQLAQDLLLQNNISFNVKNDVYFFVAHSPNQKKGFNLGVGRAAVDVPEVTGDILHIAPLYFADWRSLSRVATQLTTAKLNYMKERNAVLISGSREQILQVIKIINAFDRPSAKGRHIGIIDLVYISPQEFKEQLEEVFKIEGVQIVTNGNQEGTVAITPMARQRSVLIHSASEPVFERVMYWASKLDIPSTSDGKRYFTYFPRNVSAVDMGQSLGTLFGLNKDAKKTGKSSSSDSTTAGSAEVEIKDLSMAVDEIQNALVFYATPSKYHEVLELINQLDVMPGQVLIEAAVAEVTLEGNFSKGINWTLNSSNVRDKSSSVLSLADGLSYVISGLDFNATLSFLESNSKVNIVSRPRLLVRDGKAASMNVGTEVPVITQSVSEVESSDKVLQTVQYRSTGVSLQVTPTINAKGVVSLSLSQSVSEAGENKSSTIDSPIILNRSFNTELLALNGKTVVLGGLISENTSSGSSGVPFLADIPILGNLFKNSNQRKNRVELIVMITPRIITKQQDIDDVIEVFSTEYQNMSVPKKLN